MTRYIVKYLSFIFDICFIIIFNARIPTINAVKKPNISPTMSHVSITFDDPSSKISINMEAHIIGTLIKNENFETSAFFPPQSNPTQMVEPDLEIPGKIAIPCAIPIKKLCLYNSFLPPFFGKKSARKRIIAVNIKKKGRNLSTYAFFAIP